MTRRCFHCSHDGHNSRTCPNRGVKLFGVRLTDGSIRKSASMGNLSLLAGSSGGASPADGPEPGGGGASADGYASEDFVKGSSASCRERKKGEFLAFTSFKDVEVFLSVAFILIFPFSVHCNQLCHFYIRLNYNGFMDFLLMILVGNPWTEEEHRRFLLGLQKLGKGDWRGISRNYVVSRTPTQVASHAQKYFIRKANMTRRKRRSSLFDMEPDEVTLSLSLSLFLSLSDPFKSHILFAFLFIFYIMHDPSFFFPQPLEPQPFLMSFQESDAQNNKPPPIPPTLNEEYESMDSNDSIIEAVVSQPEASQCSYPVILPAYFSPFLQFSFPNWSGNRSDTSEQQAHVIIKPTPVHSTTAINVDELVGMSKLSIGESAGEKSSTLDLLGGSKRQSAFHANPSTRAHT
ncbi:unnamed protein product [Musa hybrid cultivar]